MLVEHKSSANNRLCRTHNIQACFGKFSIIIVSKIFELWLTCQGQKSSSIFGAAFHELKHEPSLKSL